MLTVLFFTNFVLCSFNYLSNYNSNFGLQNDYSVLKRLNTIKLNCVFNKATILSTTNSLVLSKCDQAKLRFSIKPPFCQPQTAWFSNIIILFITQLIFPTMNEDQIYLVNRSIAQKYFSIKQKDQN